MLSFTLRLSALPCPLSPQIQRIQLRSYPKPSFSFPLSALSSSPRFVWMNTLGFSSLDSRRSFGLWFGSLDAREGEWQVVEV